MAKVLCALIPRFQLIAACADRWELLRTPAVLAPEPGRLPTVGQTSRAAETYGIRLGMRLGEALARCPELNLVPPDPARAERLWEETLRGLERIGAEVESERPGEALLETVGLHGIHGGPRGTVEAVRQALAGHRALRASTRIAVAPTRFAARLAAEAGEREGAAHREVSADQLRDFLSPLPIDSLAQGLRPCDADPARLAALIDDFERLGLLTLGDLAELRADQVTDRFGRLGAEARRLARGGAEALRPRQLSEPLAERLDLPDSSDGSQLSHALELLIDRLLALPGRRERTIRSLGLSAELAGGGSWRIEVALNRPSGSAEILRLALIPRLAALPGPATSLGLRVLELAGTDPNQGTLLSHPGERRRGRIAEAVRQTRAAAGSDSLLRVLSLNADSYLPERRLTLSPYETRANE